MEMMRPRKAGRATELRVRGRRLLLALCLAAGLGLLAPEAARAWPSKYTSCTSCHNLADADGTVSAAANGAPGTSVSVAPGATFELDFIIRNVSGNGVMGVEIALPTGWTIAAGTANAPALAGWNGVWDAAAGAVWATGNGYSTANEFPASPQGYTMNFAGTGWDSGNRDAAFDDGSGGDLDGTANEMGSDVRVTVPGGTGNGSYTIQLIGVGHEGNKAFKAQAITVNVSSGGGDSTAPTPGTVSVTPESGSHVPAAFTVTTAFSDAESAVSGCEYTLNGGGAWSNGTVTGSLPNFTCTANVAGQADGAALSVNMRATSGGGTGVATAIARTVDAAAPTTADDAPAGWQAGDQSVTLTPADGTGSGVAATEYCVDTANSCVPGTAGTSVSVTQGAGTAGTRYVRYRSADNLGNLETIRSATVQIDKSLPADGTLNITPGNAQNSLSWTSASDTGSGLRTGTVYDVRFLAGGTAPTCATGTSLYIGDNLSYTHTGLTNGSTYSYRVCAYDNVNNVSAGAFGSATPTLVNSPPNSPPGASLVQYRADGTTPVAAGTFTASASPVMKATASDPDGDTVQLEVEIRPVASAFGNAPNCTSGPAVASGGTAEASCGPLADGLYKWQARVKDSNGDTSAWVQY